MLTSLYAGMACLRSQTNKTLVWGATIAFGKLGVIYNTFFVMFSAAMTGGGMITRSGDCEGGRRGKE